MGTHRGYRHLRAGRNVADVTHVGIIGAGSIGGHIATLLAADGNSVSVTARGTNLDVIQDRGLRVEGAFGDFAERVRASPSLPEVDCIILATKTIDTEAAISANPIVRERPVLVIQNGLSPHARVAHQLGHDRVAAGIATTAANLIEPGTVRITAAGKLFIGGPERELFTDLLAPAVPDVSSIENIEGAQWTKLVINMVNAVPALVGLSVQETIADDSLRRIVTASMRETIRIGLASGIRFQSLQGLTPALLRMIAYAPLAIGAAVPKRMAAAMGDVPNLGSTQQSIVRGKPTEVDYLNGATVEAAEAIGRRAPVNEAITAMVHERELRDSPFDAEEVVSRVPLR